MYKTYTHTHTHTHKEKQLLKMDFRLKKMPKEASKVFFLFFLFLRKQAWYNSERSAREMAYLKGCTEHSLLAEASTPITIVLFWMTCLDLNPGPFLSVLI